MASLNPCLGLSENSETCQQENLQLNNYIVETLTNPPLFMTLKIGLGVCNWIYYIHCNSDSRGLHYRVCLLWLTHFIFLFSRTLLLQMISLLNMDFLLKKLVRYLDKHLLNKFFYYYVDDFWKQSSNNAIPTLHNVKSSKQTCIILVYQTTQRWDFWNFPPMENSSKNSKTSKRRADIIFLYPSLFYKQNFASPKINWLLLAKGEIYFIQAQNNIPLT